MGRRGEEGMRRGERKRQVRELYREWGGKEVNTRFGS